MAKATTTTYLEIESIGADKLITTMAGLQKSLNFVAGMLKDLNKGLGLSSSHAKKGAEAMTEQAQATATAAAQATQLRVAMAQQMATTADLAKTVKSLSEEQKKQSKSLDWQAVAAKVHLAKQAYSAVKGVLVEVGQEAMRVAKAWEVQEQAELRLSAAIQGSPAKGHIEDYKAWASAIQAATAYGDEQVLALAAQASQLSKSEAQTKAATKAALDWAAATGGDAQRAIKAMGQAMSGTGEGLRQLGIYMTEADKQLLKQASDSERLDIVTQKLAESYGGFAEALATTPTAALLQAQNILGDIDEQVGKLVSPALYAGLGVVKDYLSGQLQDIQAITDDAQALKRVQDSIVSALGAAAATLIDIKTILVVIKNAAEAAVGVFLAAMTSGLKPLGEAVQLLAKLPGLGDSARATFRDLGEALAMPFDASVAGIKSDIAEAQKAIAEGEALKERVWSGLKAGQERYEAAAAQRQAAAGIGARQSDSSASTAKSTSKPTSLVQSPLPTESQLDKELELMQSYMAKTEAISVEFAAKRQALEQSTIIDYESKLEYKSELDRQEQESLKALKLDYARQTGDELTLLEEQYRQDRLAKDLEAEEKLRAEQEATMTKLADNLKSVTGQGIDMFASWIEGTGDWRQQLYDALKSSSINLMKSSIATLIDSAIINQAKAQESQANIPVVGPVLALIAGAAMFATTMALKSKLKQPEVQYSTGGYISAGMVRGGAWGRDSVAAMLEPGERVLSKSETEAYDNSRARGERDIQITLNISGQLSTPAQITDTVRRVLVPELRSAIRSGYAL